MRILKFNGQEIYIQANVLTPFFYRQQFDGDFYEAVADWLTSQRDLIGYKLIWALSKSSDFDLIDFDQWLSFFESGSTDWHSLEAEIAKFYKNIKTTTKTKKSSEPFEAKLITSAMRSGISLDALKIMLPSDLIESVNEERTATQEDIDSLLI